ncbi:MAG TPA: prenyltransferase/squalene oxidase repeat-containing protein, partial [Pirellulales bacterium]|nr:prenyltransferase/squalene oxidase repeat-containing protein [Pirellulales bacterium]
GTGVKGRGDAKSRATLVKQNGGTDASEAAVAAALKWFSEHQNGDGSWNFDHRVGPCEGRCGDPGEKSKASLAATGMALLPFLGAGQTHKQGKYKKQVEGALYYLTANMETTGDMTDHGSGAMYGHGIASIALCEAYAMTHDKQLQAPAQAALNFIADAQDPVGGGWRYKPRQAGDTSVVGWQIMALKSGHLGFLTIDPRTVKGATKFLNAVQADGGAQYGYDRPGAGLATSAVGLLCRMYLGWEHDKPELERGALILAKHGPTLGNIYYSYYATQVLHQFDGPDGPLWKAWNTKMRDSLVASQSKKGHETGSWFFKPGDSGSSAGGRLYCTSMATMTLEIYYRYMPIYQQKSAESPFEE